MAKYKIKLVVERDDDKAEPCALPAEPGKAAKALSRQLRITALSLILTLGMIIAATLAWFAMNRKVNSTGMQMDVQAGANLVIKEVDAGGHSDIATAVPDDISTSFTVPLRMIPATHSDDWTDPTVDYNINKDTETLLVYNSNAYRVSAATGFAKDPAYALTFDAVPVYGIGNDANYYYAEHIVDIAALNQTIEASALQATFSYGSPDDESKAPLAQPYHHAASVDFYYCADPINAPSTYTYKGTLNLTGLDSRENDTSTTKETVDVLSGAVTIPRNTEGFCRVLMRFYFDGNLKSAANQAYVYSNDLETNTMPSVYVVFQAAE